MLCYAGFTLNTWILRHLVVGGGIRTVSYLIASECIAIATLIHPDGSVWFCLSSHGSSVKYDTAAASDIP